MGGKIQTVVIYAEAPFLAFPIHLDEDLDYEMAIRLAKAELIIEMTKCIIEGKWEIERE